MRLNLKDLRRFSTYDIAYHGGAAYLYRARFGGKRARTMWIAAWMKLWPKDSYEVLAIVETRMRKRTALRVWGAL